MSSDLEDFGPDGNESDGFSGKAPWNDSSDEPQWLRTLRFLEEPIDVPILEVYPILKKFLNQDREEDWLEEFACGASGLEREPLVWPTLLDEQEEEEKTESVKKAVDNFIETFHTNDYMNIVNNNSNSGSNRIIPSRKRGHHQWLFYNQPAVTPWSLYNYALSAVPPGINLNIGDDEEIPQLSRRPIYNPRAEPLRLRQELKDPCSVERMMKARAFEAAGQELGIIAAVGSDAARSKKLCDLENATEPPAAKRKPGRRPAYLLAAHQQQSLLKQLPSPPPTFRYKNRHIFRPHPDA